MSLLAVVNVFESLISGKILVGILFQDAVPRYQKLFF